jgi:D-glycero-D-manno-heptose 1,7-bisphosphate phosphatase
MKPSKAVFFDRDGVLNQDSGYPYLPEHIRWIPGAFEAVKAANDAGYKVFVVTNQSGIARGFYTEEDVQSLHRWMMKQCAAEGGKIHDFIYCPHHPDEGRGAYRVECECRKPKPGMIQALIKKHGLDAGNSFFVGDRAIDMEAAKAAGVKGCLFTGGNLDVFLKPLLQ